MKKQFLILAIIAGGLASVSANASLKSSGSDCPDRCNSNALLCCSTPNGSIIYGCIKQ